MNHYYLDRTEWNVNDIELEEIKIRLVNGGMIEGEEAIELLRNERYPLRTVPFSGIINFIYMKDTNEPEVVKYNMSDLPNSFAILGAISTYYSNNLQSQYAYKTFNGLNYLDEGVHFVEVE